VTFAADALPGTVCRHMPANLILRISRWISPVWALCHDISGDIGVSQTSRPILSDRCRALRLRTADITLDDLSSVAIMSGPISNRPGDRIVHEHGSLRARRIHSDAPSGWDG